MFQFGKHQKKRVDLNMYFAPIQKGRTMELTNSCGRPRAVSLTAANPVAFVAPDKIKFSSFLFDLLVLCYEQGCFVSSQQNKFSA